MQRVAELQGLMKAKFRGNDDRVGGVKVGFKLPCANQLEHIFDPDSTVKVLGLNVVVCFILVISCLPPTYARSNAIHALC